jgi:protein tyrosine/serine phosphatase
MVKLNRQDSNVTMPDNDESNGFCPLDASVPVPNFRRVTPWLLRGGQPSPEGIQALADMGVRTVISLRWRRRHIDGERQQVTALGMKYINISLNYLFLPREDYIQSFLNILDNADNRPIFVHCLHGADRTGLLLAIFRITRQGWNVEDAYKEMKFCGYHRFRVRNLKWILFQFARRYQARQRSN